MSKMDNLRAMREARYAEAAARTSQPPAAGRKPATRSAVKPRGADPVPEPTPEPQAADPEPKQQDPALCGHRAISGRLCTRELGHAAKSHRYS